MADKRHSRARTAVEVASGVEALVERLRQQGVNRGRAEAGEIVNQAQAQAREILQGAQQEAEQTRNKAREEAEHLKRGGEEAVKVAFRDAVEAMRSRLMQRFAGEVRRLVGTEVEKRELLERLILEVVGRVKESAAQSQEIEVLLPRQAIGLEDLRRNPEELENAVLSQFTRLISQGMVRDGISLGVARDHQGGLRLYLKDEKIMLDLSDRAIAEALLEHLQPRFRALLEGVIK